MQHRTHAHDCWFVRAQEDKGKQFEEITATEANSAQLMKCRHCGGGR